MGPKKVNVKECLNDGAIDLSMADLTDVPVRDIAAVKNAYALDLSNNNIASLPLSFTSLTHLIKLDLSTNQLTKLPEDFGNLCKLKHLDLYANQLTHLPLSFGQFKDLKWLDLKGNPLVTAVAQVAGPCQDPQQCSKCAKDVVMFFANLQKQIDEKKQEEDDAEAAKKQQEKEKKKKVKAGGSKTDLNKAKGEVVVDEPIEAKQEVVEETVEPEVEKPFFRSIWAMVFLFVALMFVSTAMKCKQVQFVENFVLEYYNEFVWSLPYDLQVYVKSVGQGFGAFHRTTGDITLYAVESIRGVFRMIVN